MLLPISKELMIQSALDKHLAKLAVRHAIILSPQRFLSVYSFPNSPFQKASCNVSFIYFLLSTLLNSTNNVASAHPKFQVDFCPDTAAALVHNKSYIFLNIHTVAFSPLFLS